MAFVSDMEAAFLDEFAAQFTIPVILDYQGGSEPSGDYGVFGITTLNKVNRDFHNFFEDSSDGIFKERLKQDYEVLYTLSFYGNSCYDNAMKAQALLSTMDVRERLYTNNNISIIDVTSLRRIPELRDTGYVQRITFDLNALIGFEFISESDYYDTVNYISTYLDQDGTTIITDTNTVSTT